MNLLLVGYAGAGPYPQCFHFDNIGDKQKAAEQKEKQFLQQAANYINLLKPDAYAPFAGTYVLGSKLVGLTKFRGVPLISDALNMLKNYILNDSSGVLLNKLDVYDVTTQRLFKHEDVPNRTYDEFLHEIANKKLEYEDDDWNDAGLSTLMNKSYERFTTKAREIGFKSTTSLVVQSDRVAYRLSTSVPPVEVPVNSRCSEPLLRITVDHNLLHRLLRGPRFAHWNNAEIGSHLQYFRQPNTYERGLHHCICFLHQ